MSRREVATPVAVTPVGTFVMTSTRAAFGTPVVVERIPVATLAPAERLDILLYLYNTMVDE
jgi:hypothetical protein